MESSAATQRRVRKRASFQELPHNDDNSTGTLKHVKRIHYMT
jgi:hypothetical protein